MVLFCFGQGWGLFGWFSLLVLVCLCGKVGLTLSSQALFMRIVIGYKMSSSMSDKPVLPKTGVGVRKKRKGKENQEKEEASSRMLPSRMLTLKPRLMAKLVTFALCDYYMYFFLSHTKSILTLCCVSQETDFRLHLTVSLPSVFLVWIYPKESSARE